MQRLTSVSEVMGDSYKKNSLKKALLTPTETKEKKQKKPVIKKNKLQLGKKKKGKKLAKKETPNIEESSVVNNKMPILPNKKSENKKRSVWPDLKTFENFLNSRKIRFLKKDTIFLLIDFGGIGDRLYEDRFKRFMLSHVWEA